MCVVSGDMLYTVPAGIAYDEGEAGPEADLPFGCRGGATY